MYRGPTDDLSASERSKYGTVRGPRTPALYRETVALQQIVLGILGGGGQSLSGFQYVPRNRQSQLTVQVILFPRLRRPFPVLCRLCHAAAQLSRY